MRHTRTFDMAVGCPFVGDSQFPGCARWERCVCAALPRGHWVRDAFVPALNLDTHPLVGCDEFLAIQGTGGENA